MTIENILTEAMKNVEHCVAIGYVDISSGELLGKVTVHSHPSKVLEMVALATTDLFNGSNIVKIEDEFKNARGVKSTRHYFQEILVNSDNLVHYFIREQSNQNQVAVFVCRNKVLLGMGLKQARTETLKIANYFK